MVLVSLSTLGQLSLMTSKIHLPLFLVTLALFSTTIDLKAPSRVIKFRPYPQGNCTRGIKTTKRTTMSSLSEGQVTKNRDLPTTKPSKQKPQDWRTPGRQSWTHRFRFRYGHLVRPKRRWRHPRRSKTTAATATNAVVATDHQTFTSGPLFIDNNENAF